MFSDSSNMMVSFRSRVLILVPAYSLAVEQGADKEEGIQYRAVSARQDMSTSPNHDPSIDWFLFIFLNIGNLRH
jgi:hypothetical protein